MNPSAAWVPMATSSGRRWTAATRRARAGPAGTTWSPLSSDGTCSAVAARSRSVPPGPQPPAAGQGLADADLVGPVGVRTAPGDDQRTVDGPADAAVDAHLAEEPGAPGVLARVAGHGRGEQDDALQPQLGHLREPPQAVEEARVVDAPDLDLDVVGQGRLQQAGVGGVGAAGADGGGHDGAGGHPDQQGQPQQGAPAGPKPSPRQRPHRRHRALPPGSVSGLPPILPCWSTAAQ